MKKAFSLQLISIFSFLIILSSCNQRVTSGIPENVSKSFKKTFPNATNVKWELSSENFEVKFKINDTKFEILYDEQGNILEKESEVDVKELPTSILEYISAQYPNYKIKKVEKAEKDNKQFFEVKIELDQLKIDLYFDLKGSFIEKEKDGFEEKFK